MLSDELLLKIDDLENKEYEKCLDKSNLELFSYNGEDQFSRFITAEKMINRAITLFLIMMIMSKLRTQKF